MAAIPAKRAIAFLHRNLIVEYGRERAVADGVNLGYDVCRIQTEVGGQVEKDFVVTNATVLPRHVRAQVLDDDLAYATNKLDRSIAVPTQIRTILQACKDAVSTVLFPGRSLVPETLFSAKDDSHAEDVVRLHRERFGKGNNFCKKFNYGIKHVRSEDLIQEYYAPLG